MMKAVIMAGGKGTRLRPLTVQTPKPMVPLLGRPVMEYIVEWLKSYRITEIAVTLQYMPDEIIRYFGDGSKWGVQLHYFEEEEPLGTAGSIKNAAAFLDESFFVVSGDALCDFNLFEAAAFHRKHDGLATVLLSRVSEPLEYGMAMLNEDQSIHRFVEKPSWGEIFSDTVNTGIYILDPETVSWIEAGQERDFSKHIFPEMLKRDQVYGMVADGYWSDIGGLAQYRSTQFDMLEGRVNLPLPGIEHKPGIRVEKDAELHPAAHLTAPIYVGKGCRVAEAVQLGSHTVIGANTRIGKRSSLAHAIIGAECMIGDDAELFGTTLSSGVIVEKGASIADNTVIGRGCLLETRSIVREDVKLYPNKQIEAHSVVTQSIIYSSGQRKRLFSGRGIRGQAGTTLSPSFIQRLANAYAKVLKNEYTNRGRQILLSTDASPFAEIMAEILKTGLHAAGFDTLYMSDSSLPVSRWAVKEYSLCGGVHLYLDDNKRDTHVLEFIDEEGLPFHSDLERKLEIHYDREASAFSESGAYGREIDAASLQWHYSQSLIKTVNPEGKRFKKNKVLVSCPSISGKQRIREILAALHGSVEWAPDSFQSKTEFQEAVIRAQADLGVRFDEQMEQLTFIAENGQLLPEQSVYTLQLILQCVYHDSAISVPVYLPNAAEQLVRSYGKHPIRIKSDRRSIMQAGMNQGHCHYYDGMFTLTQLLRYLHEQDVSLSALLKTIPDLSIFKMIAPCSWTNKGRVMRNLLDENKGHPIECIEGIKIYYDHGWSLILPDLEKPMFRIFIQMEDRSSAEQLGKQFCKKIDVYQNEQGVD